MKIDVCDGCKTLGPYFIESNLTCFGGRGMYCEECLEAARTQGYKNLDEPNPCLEGSSVCDARPLDSGGIMLREIKDILGCLLILAIVWVVAELIITLVMEITC